MIIRKDSRPSCEPGGVTHPADGEVNRVSRRAVIAGAALSVPAIAMMSTSPAWAVSSNSLSVSTPSGQVRASGATPVSAIVKDPSGAAVTGAVVSFTGPAGASFAPASATTDASGTAATQMDLGTAWATPGSTVTVTAVAGSVSASLPATVLGSNLLVAGDGYSSTFAQSELVFPSPVVEALTPTAWDMVLLADGTVWTKGANTYGQLGDGTTTDRSTWAAVAGLSGVTQIAAGVGTGYAMLSDGSVRAWGWNRYGQLGDGSTTDRLTPGLVPGLPAGATQVVSSTRTGYVLSANGSVWSWGFNKFGQIGDGSTTDRLTPGPVSGLTSGVTQLAAGGYTVYSLSSDGSVRGWGSGKLGQTGDGAALDRSTPVSVSGLSGVKRVTAGYFGGYALFPDGSVKAWGANGQGSVGDGSTANRVTPVQVSGLTSGVTQVEAGISTAYALSSDGSVRAWGYNAQGQVGDGSTTNRPTPVSVALNLPAGRVVRRLGVNSASSVTPTVIVSTS